MKKAICIILTIISIMSVTACFAYASCEGGHTPSGNWTVVKHASYEESGKRVKYCTVCGKALEEETTDRIKHYDSTVVFCDVYKNSWFKDSADYVYSYGLMGGIGNGKFAPNDLMTRAMVVTVLWRWHGSPTGYRNSFADVKKGKWFCDPVSWASENKIVNGVGDGRFDPDGYVTREQIAAIIYRYAEYSGRDITMTADLSSFQDADRVHSWGKKAMAWANAAGIVTGSSNALGKLFLMPGEKAKRSEVAAMLSRFCR